MRVWIDLTNSPHVLVMRPIIELLEADGHEVRVTARDFAQTIALCERFGIEHTQIGRHRGERLRAKALGLASRSAALVRWARAQQRRRHRNVVGAVPQRDVEAPASGRALLRPCPAHQCRRP
jgi:predicted glycosyltransferase